MASITARRSVLRGRPPALAGGRRGAITAHSRSVMSLGYRADKRLWSWRVVSSQAISSSASRPGGGNHSSLISLKFTGRGICLCGELRSRGRCEDVWGVGSGGFGDGGRQHGGGVNVLEV